MDLKRWYLLVLLVSSTLPIGASQEPQLKKTQNAQQGYVKKIALGAIAATCAVGAYLKWGRTLIVNSAADRDGGNPVVAGTSAVRGQGTDRNAGDADSPSETNDSVIPKLGALIKPFDPAYVTFVRELKVQDHLNAIDVSTEATPLHQCAQRGTGKDVLKAALLIASDEAQEREPKNHYQEYLKHVNRACTQALKGQTDISRVIRPRAAGTKFENYTEIGPVFLIENLMAHGKLQLLYRVTESMLRSSERKAYEAVVPWLQQPAPQIQRYTSYKDDPYKKLSRAIQQGNVDNARTLLASNINPNIWYGKSALTTPLMMATSLQNTSMIQLLLQHGADILQSDSIILRRLDISEAEEAGVDQSEMNTIKDLNDVIAPYMLQALRDKVAEEQPGLP